MQRSNFKRKASRSPSSETSKNKHSSKKLQVSPEIIQQLLQYQMQDLSEHTEYALDTTQTDIIYTERIYIYNAVRNHLNIMQKEKKEMPKCIENINDTIQISHHTDKIIFERNIGAGSGGVVSIFEGRGSLSDGQEISLYKTAAKIMHIEYYNINEILYFILLKNEILSKHIPHYPLMYVFMYCDENNDATRLALQTIDRSITPPYLIVLSELADGTFKSLLDSNISSDDYLSKIYSAIAQIMISFCFFNKLGHSHKDCTNLGNYLYNKLPKKHNSEYIRYAITINSKTFYYCIKHFGVVWMLNDFGNSTQLNIGFDNDLTTEDIDNFLKGIIFVCEAKLRSPNGRDSSTSTIKNAKIIELMKFINETLKLQNTNRISLISFMKFALNNSILFTPDKNGELIDKSVNKVPYTINFDNNEFTPLKI